MNELIWKTEGIMQEELNKIALERDFTRYGCDGNILAATGIFEYKGMKYVVNVLRYYIIKQYERKGYFIPMSIRKSEYFANLEYPDDMKEIVLLVKSVKEYSDTFLYNDTLHSYADSWNIEMQVNKMHEEAKSDIDSLPKLIDEIDEKILKLVEIRKQIKDMGC
jgi:hypothetical protein